jgi:prepilin-type N-terminal cleavage/methylation domain-containing protein
MHARRGFTLIELLIVISIIAILSGMVMTMMGTVRRTSMKSATLSVERKVETALRLFKDEYFVYPYQNSYPAMSSTAVGQYFPNNLAYHLGTNISTADNANVNSDVCTAQNQYNYNAQVQGTYLGFTEYVQPSIFTFTAETTITTAGVHCLSGDIADHPGPVPPAQNCFNLRGSIAILLNRMAQEWVGNAMLAGAVAVKGQVIYDCNGTVTQDLSASNILSSPATCASSANPGWANDYIAGDVEKRFIAGNDIVDAWHHPLIYISQVIPGVKGASCNTNGYTIMPFDCRYYSLGVQGFDAGSGPTASLVTANRRLLLGDGRIRLSLTDAGDGMPTPVDPTYFPNAANLMQADMRYYAAQGYESEFELWSAGNDGRFTYMRSDDANGDNVSATEYNRGLQ